MLKVAWRDVRFHPVRFVMSVLAVVLGVAFVSGTLALRTMLGSTFDQIIDSALSGDAAVVADDGSTHDPTGVSGTSQGLVPDSLVPLIEALPQVKWASADYTGPITLIGADGTPVTSGQAPSMAVVADPAIAADQGFELTGKRPLGEHEMVLESQTAKRAGLGIGDTTTVILGGRAPAEMTVTGIVTTANSTQFAGAVIIGIDRATAKAVFAPTGAVATITVKAVDGVSQDELARAVAAVLPADAHATVKTMDTMRAEARDAIGSILGFISVFLMVFAVIALFVGAFIIANTFSMVVRQRLRESAVLRALGASPSQVFVSFVAQAGIVGLIGSALGVGAGFALVIAIRSVFDSMGMPLSGAVPVTVGGVAVPMVVGVLVAMGAAALPARRASRTAPVEAMRPDGPDTQRSLKVRGVVGAVMSLGGVVALVGAHSAGDGSLLGLGAALLLVGLIVVSPVLAPAITQVLAWPFAVASRPFGTLAQRNLVRNKRRTANTAAALMIGMALVGAATVIASSASASVDDLVGSQMKADLILNATGTTGIPQAAVQEMSQVPGATVLTLGTVPGTVEVPGRAGTLGAGGEIGVMDPQVFVSGFAPDIVAGSPQALTDGVVLSQSVAEQAGLTAGDTVRVTLANDTPFQTTADLQVQLVYSSAAMDMGAAVTEQTADRLLPPDVQTQLVVQRQAFVLVAPGTSVADVQARLTDIVAPYHTISVMDRKEFTTFVGNQVDQMLSILYALLALSLVIAVLGVINTLALSVVERTQEIGMMRAVGLGRGQLRWTMVIEGALVAGFGAVLGIGAGVGVASVLPSTASSVGLGVLSVPWLTVAALFVGAAVVGVLAAVWPAVRAARVPVLQALVYD